MRIRSVLALRQVAIQEGLQVTDEAIDGEFVNLVVAGRITEEQFEDYRGDGRRRLQVANALVQQQLHDFLFANNTFNEVEEDIADLNRRRRDRGGNRGGSDRK